MNLLILLLTTFSNFINQPYALKGSLSPHTASKYEILEKKNLSLLEENIYKAKQLRLETSTWLKTGAGGNSVSVTVI